MKKTAWIITVTILIVMILAYLGAGYAVYDQLTKLAPTDVATMPNTPSNFKVTYPEYASFDTTLYFISHYEVVNFPSRQAGINLSGWYMEVNPAAPVVIVTHGIGASKKDANVLVPAGMLVRNGFNVLMFDIRNCGDSDKDNGRTSVGNKEYQDVLGAWDWLIKEKGFSAERIGLYGVSLGAGTTLIAFGEEPRAAATFVDSPFADLPEIITAELARNHYPTILTPAGILMARIASGTDLLAHSPKEAIYNDNNRPIYIVHGTADTRISVNQTRELSALAQQKGANVTVWIPDGIAHAAGVFTLPQEYEQRLVEFFKSSLK